MPDKSVSDLSNVEIVILAVSDLGGEVKAIDVEDIAINAYNYAPEKFSWRKYKDHIDIRVVVYAIKDASTPKKGPPLLTGSYKHGFMLSPDGKQWINEFKSSTEIISDNAYRSKSTTEKIILEQNRLLASSAYQKFITGQQDNITDVDVQDFTRVNEYFPLHARKRRYVLIDNAVKVNPDLESCWFYLKSKFIKNGDQNA